MNRLLTNPFSAGAVFAILLASFSAEGQESLADLPSFRDGCQALEDERFETAITSFRNCWAILQENETGEAEKNFVASRLLESLVRDRSTDQAIAWVRENPLLNPSPQTAYWIAVAYQEQERFEEAAEYYNLFISSTPNAGNTAIINRAICLARSDREEAAFDLVHEAVQPQSAAESFRLAQIAAATSRFKDALSYLDGIGPLETYEGPLRFSLTRLKVWIFTQTGQEPSAYETAYQLIEGSRDAESARLAFLLLEQLIGKKVPAGLEERFEAWESSPDFPGRDAARLFRILLFAGPDTGEKLHEFLPGAENPGIKLECRIRLDEIENRANDVESLSKSRDGEPVSSSLREQFGFAGAQASYLNGAFDAATRRFIEMADTAVGEGRSRNLYNAALSALRNGDTAAFTTAEEALARTNPRSTLLADLVFVGGLYYAAKGDPKAFERLNTFVREHPEHEANVEAQLALAEINLNQAPARPQAAREIFDGLRTRPLTLTQSERLDYTSIWIERTERNIPALIRRSEEFINNWPSSGYLEEVIMILASELFEMKNLKAAESYFKLVREKFPDSPHAGTAQFFEARSSPPGEDTIEKWKAMIGGGGALSFEARHELGLLYLSLERFADAKEQFNWLLENLPADAGLRFAAMADLGFAYYAEALADDRDPEKLEEAAEKFTALSNLVAAPPVWRYNAAVRRGKCLEALGRNSVALEIYRSIVDETRSISPGLIEELPPRETEWVFRAGFAAIDLLMLEQNWAVAISVADALAEKNGPRAIEAARLAERLRLKHWVWD